MREHIPPAVDGVEQRLDAVLDLLGDIRDRLPAREPDSPADQVELREPDPPSPPAVKPARKPGPKPRGRPVARKSGN